MGLENDVNLIPWNWAKSGEESLHTERMFSLGNL